MTSLKLSSQMTAAALFAVVAVGTAGAWFVEVGPQRSKAAQLSTDLQAKQAQVTQQQQAKQSSTGGLTKQQLAAIAAAMPDQLGMPQVVDQLNVLAGRANVTLDSISPNAPTIGAGYTAVPMTVVVDGDYFDVQQFLHVVRTEVTLKKKLHAAGRLIDVQSVALSQTEPAPKVTATLAMEAFYYTGVQPTVPDPTATTTTSDSTSSAPSAAGAGS